jgi:hypothetical protein
MGRFLDGSLIVGRDYMAQWAAIDSRTPPASATGCRPRAGASAHRKIFIDCVNCFTSFGVELAYLLCAHRDDGVIGKEGF